MCSICLSQLSNVVVNCLNPFFKVDCKSGRILNTDDFKFLARKVSLSTFESFIIVFIQDDNLKCFRVGVWVFERSLLSTTAIEQYFHVVQFIMLHKVVLTFKSVNETLVCDHSMKAIEQYFHVVLFIMLYKVF